MNASLSQQKDQSQSGNMLIYIIGAIFLLGLLVVMVRGSTTPGANIDRETLELRASQVQQYGSELERAVSYILRNGYSESDIRFAHPNAVSTYGDITDTPDRQIFDRRGGGAEWRDNYSDIQTQDEDWVFSGTNLVNQVGTGSNELLAWLPYVTQSFCLLINDKASVDNPADVPPQDTGNLDITTLFAGSFTATQAVTSTETNGKYQGCIEGDVSPASGTYHYYRVLLPR